MLIEESTEEILFQNYKKEELIYVLQAVMCAVDTELIERVI